MENGPKIHLKPGVLASSKIPSRILGRVAFIDAAKFLRAKGAGLARRTRQRRADPGFRLLLLLTVQTASAALLAKPRQSIDPSSSYRRRQPWVVSCQQREPWRPPRRSSHRPRERAHWPVAPADVPPRRPAPKRSGRRGLSGDRKPSRNHAQRRIQKSSHGKQYFGFPMS